MTCPSCGQDFRLEIAAAATPISTEAKPPMGTVERWLLDHPWIGERSSAELFEAFQREAGGESWKVSHRRFSLDMQACGVEKFRGHAGRRMFRRYSAHELLPNGSEPPSPISPSPR